MRNGPKSATPMPVEGAYETDNAIAEESGEIYFYSPEVLDAPNGTQGEQNLYRYHDGTVTFVAAFPSHEEYCPNGEHCSNGPIGRIQISPGGEHVALLTNAQLTPYNNNEFEEMYYVQPGDRQDHLRLLHAERRTADGRRQRQP